MKICMIAEGCYPYVVGGVSGWMQMMITGFKEHEFQVFSIGADPSQRGQYKYELPENLTAVHESFLLEDTKAIKNGKVTRYPGNISEPLKKLVCSDPDTPWAELYRIVRDKSFSTQSYLGSYDFFDAARERYTRDKVTTGFSDYLWTMRSMFMPMFSLLEKDIPESDLYHAASAGYAGIVGALGAVVYGKPFIMSEHGIYTREREEELIRSKWTKDYFKEMWIRHFYSMSLFAYQKADVVLSLFEKNGDIQKDLGCPSEKIRIIPNGVAPEDFLSASKSAESLAEEQETAVHVGAVIRVTPIKDIKTMLSAFKEVQNKSPDTVFHILGPCDEDPDYYRECLALMKQLKLENCEMPGRVNVRDYLPKMDILVLTSISEGQPLSILEGMLYKKPWVSTNVGSCPELLEGMSGDSLGAAGLIAPIMDVKQIAKCILTLIEDPILRVEMGRVGYRRVTEKYKKSEMFRGYREIYADLSPERKSAEESGDKCKRPLMQDHNGN